MTALKACHGPARSSRVVVQGFGTVGRSVAKFLDDRGHRIIGVADVSGTVSSDDRLPVGELISITDHAGRVDRSRLPDTVSVSADQDAWLDLEADVVILAANMNAINEGNVHRLSAGLVVEGGNLCCSPQAKELLISKGIMLIPDVVANVGGAAAGGCALTGTVPFDLPQDQMVAWVFDWVEQRVHRNTRDILEIIHSTTDDPIAELLVAQRKPTC
jgi:glutamate dehydrogenase (NAD(P)+)